jgi:hypothetical protein
MTDDSRVSFVVKGVGAFFAFLVAFLAVSNYFGGGITAVEVSVALALSVALGLVLVWPRLRIPAVPTAEIPTVRENRHSTSGTYTVVPGKHTKIPLRIRKGETLDGFLAEVESQYFDWWIVDEENLVRYLDTGDEGFEPLEGEIDVTASKVQCEIPHDGPWYLLLDVTGKQNRRDVEVNLRVE